MKKVAKLILIDSDDQYLIMYRANHPYFGNDADLPGGTLEKGETHKEAMIREVYEETGITIDDAQEVYRGLGYSFHGTQKSLFITKLKERPEVKLSWEHGEYDWVSRDAFLKQAKNAKDTYMHLAYDILTRHKEDKDR